MAKLKTKLEKEISQKNEQAKLVEEKEGEVGRLKKELGRWEKYDAQITSYCKTIDEENNKVKLQLSTILTVRESSYCLLQVNAGF